MKTFQHIFEHSAFFQLKAKSSKQFATDPSKFAQYFEPWILTEMFVFSTLWELSNIFNTYYTCRQKEANNSKQFATDSLNMQNICNHDNISSRWWKVFMRLWKRKFPCIANIVLISMGLLQIFFGTVSKIISIGSKSILKCPIFPFLKTYKPHCCHNVWKFTDK